MPTKPKPKRKRLTDIKVKELSLVDEPAIGEYFAIVKRDTPVEKQEDEEDEDEKDEKKKETGVKKAFDAALKKLREVAGDMDAECLGLLANLMSFSKWKWAEDEMYKADDKLSKLVDAAAWTDEQWILAKNAVAEPEPEPVPSEETPENVVAADEQVAEPVPPPPAPAPVEQDVVVEKAAEVKQTIDPKLATSLRILGDRLNESVTLTRSLADEVRLATGKVL